MPSVPARIMARQTYCAAEIVSLRKIRPRTSTSTMLDPANTALARPAGIVRVAYENMTKPSRSASTPASRWPGRSHPWAWPSSTTPVTSAMTVTTRKTMPRGATATGRGYSRGISKELDMIELRTPGELDAMRAAGAVVADMLAAVRVAAAPGVRLTELDEVARGVLADAGATSPFLGYAPLPTTPPFPGVVCLSVNDVALHGIPTPQELEDGDLLSVNAGATLDGWVGDAAITFPVGTAHPGDLALVATAERALEAGIAAAVVGNRVGDISAAIAAVGRGGGCGAHPDEAGHGVGRTIHEAPHVPNEARAGRGVPLRPGL